MNTHSTSGEPVRRFDFTSPDEYLEFYEKAVLGFPLESVCRRLNRVRTKTNALYAIPDETFARIEELVLELQATIRACDVTITEYRPKPTLRLVHGGSNGQE